VKTFMRTLPVTLTHPELLARGEALALERWERNQVDAARKASGAGFRERLEDHDAEIDRLAGIVRDKAEPRPVECKSVRDQGRGVIEVTRLDTGEIVESRVMSELERQTRIFEPDEEPGDPIAAGGAA
jgi:hypothetical protein